MMAKELIDCEPVGLDYFGSAPVCVRVHEVVAASPEAIFEVFLDAEAWTTWAPPITDVEWTSPLPLEVGSTRTVRMWGGLVGYERFIAWEPPRRMAFRFDRTVSGGPAAFAEDYVVTDLGEGRALVEWAMAMTLTGPSAALSGVTRRAMKPINRTMLGRLGRLVESTEPHPGRPLG